MTRIHRPAVRKGPERQSGECTDITDEGYDFNGWILEFYQENCNGIVQVDGQGFYSPKGTLIVDMSAPDPEE